MQEIHCLALLMLLVRFDLASVCLSAGLWKTFWPNVHATWWKGVAQAAETTGYILERIQMTGADACIVFHLLFFTWENSLDRGLWVCLQAD